MSGRPLPGLVRGVVTRHEPYGFFLDFGDEQEGVVVITMIGDDPSQSNPEFPSVGALVDAVLLGYTELGGQPRLSIRPSDLRAAASSSDCGEVSSGPVG
ncbi:MAG: binding domain [Actinomycetota bacterium]|nr:binding domain [Actinomycetota bacterium]